MKIKWLAKKVGTKIWENRSNIEFIAGNIAVAVGTGMVISKAEEATEVKHEMERQIKEIELADEADGWEDNHERAKACFNMAKSTALGYAKVYGPGIAVEAGGLVLMGISHVTDRKEIAAKSVALASLATQFYNYRENVRKELGEAKDEEFLIGKPETIVTTDENGKQVTEEKPLVIPDHSFIFDEHNPNFEKEGFMNLDFLTDHERWLNEKLWNEGLLWENDIRRDIGEAIDPNASAGDWGITAVDDNGNRNYISFGINKNTERAQSFRDGSEKAFLVILNNMEPNISKKLYRLNKYHMDYSIQQAQ